MVTIYICERDTTYESWSVKVNLTLYGLKVQNDDNVGSKAVFLKDRN